jgi:hypothetical protein
VTLNAYIVEVFCSSGQPQLTEHRVLAWSAQDAVFQLDFNTIRKSKTFRDGEWIPTSNVYSVRPDAPCGGHSPGVPKP